ncbi:MAG: hypothetical protein CSA39_01980 [Flavobacteriales bacterium]|nr:MAG: hypothetical protein CSA39_01980 [Flavobacteriales bacterium]
MAPKKFSVFSAFKYLIFALPLLIIAPVVITIGFKALAKDNSFIILVIGIILALLAIVITALGVIRVVRYIFERDHAS